MTLYEVNKMAYANAPILIDADSIKSVIGQYVTKHPSMYYMLLNNEKHYYTIFHMRKFQSQLRPKLIDEIYDIANELGQIKDVLINDNGALEIWVNTGEEILMFLLFNYEQGVIEI